MRAYKDEFGIIQEFIATTSMGTVAIWQVKEFGFYDFSAACKFVRNAEHETTAGIILIDAQDRKLRSVLKACGFRPMPKSKRLEAYPYIANMYCAFDE